MANIIENTWSETHPVVKTGIVVVAVLGTIFIGVKIYKNIDFIVAKIKGLGESASASRDLSQEIQQGNAPTLSDSEIQAMVSTLVTALQGCTEDEETAYNTLNKIKNKADWLKLQSQFGTKSISECGWGSSVMTLSQLLHYGLNSDEIGMINSLFLSKGISVTI